MKTQSISASERAIIILFVVILFVAAKPAVAKTYVIQFGGSLGLTYSPNSLSVSVGDTIEWEGDFSMHPLSTTSIPAGAATIHHPPGTVFTYPVTVAGTYDYQCDVHYSLGMVGSFTASSATGIKNDQTSSSAGAFSFVSTLVFNLFFVNLPLQGPPVESARLSLVKTSFGQHLLGIALRRRHLVRGSRGRVHGRQRAPPAPRRTRHQLRHGPGFHPHQRPLGPAALERVQGRRPENQIADRRHAGALCLRPHPGLLGPALRPAVSEAGPRPANSRAQARPTSCGQPRT